MIFVLIESERLDDIWQMIDSNLKQAAVIKVRPILIFHRIMRKAVITETLVIFDIICAGDLAGKKQADDEGYEDDLAMRSMMEVLSHYFEKHGKLSSYIWSLNTLGGFYNRAAEVSGGKRAAEYFEKLRGLKSQIAFESGFNSVPYFIKQFQSITEKTPGEYRELIGR